MITDYMKKTGKPVVKVLVEAPVRIMDFGGWTDTWFAGHGKVLCLSVLSRDATKGRGQYHGIEAIAKVSVSPGNGAFKLRAPDVNKSLSCSVEYEDWDKEDLIEATLSKLRKPQGVSVDIVVRSPVVPKGSSVGSSATVSVALTALLDFMSRSEVDPSWVARTCHEVETQIMGIECGVQDQAAASHAYGANFIDIYRYPNFSVEKVALTESTKRELEERCLTIIYGGCHSSSDIHKMVIDSLQNVGRLAPGLEHIRNIPEEARFCLLSGDFVGLGKAMRKNTVAQRELHPDLISPVCQELIDFCHKQRTFGEKVNGAGGPQGGSLTVLCGDVSKEVVASRLIDEFDVLVLEHKIADRGVQVSII